MKDKIIRFFYQDRYAVHSGIELVDVEPGYALTKMEIKEYHLNAAGIVQGGAIFTLADLAFAAASNATGHMTLALNASISFFKPGLGEYLQAEARQVSDTRRTCFYEIKVTDARGDLVALFNGTGFKKDKTINFE
ncbi:MAG: PaaI family thioesterase [Syntrophomonadaceae bacterium]